MEAILSNDMSNTTYSICTCTMNYELIMKYSYNLFLALLSC